jgi:hypothetical protein
MAEISPKKKPKKAEKSRKKPEKNGGGNSIDFRTKNGRKWY